MPSVRPACELCRPRGWRTQDDESDALPTDHYHGSNRRIVFYVRDPGSLITAWAFVFYFRRLFITVFIAVAFLLALASLAPRLDAPSMWGDVRPRAVPSSPPFDGTPQGPGSSPYVAYLGASEMRALAHERQRHHYVVASPTPEIVTFTPAMVASLIRSAATEFRQDADAMVAVGHCESTLNPLAVGKAGERGVFQFMPSTWKANAARLGYGEDDVWDPLAAARVTAEMWSRQQQWQWTCWKGG